MEDFEGDEEALGVGDAEVGGVGFLGAIEIELGDGGVGAGGVADGLLEIEGAAEGVAVGEGIGVGGGRGE